jgi:hypothetical protein
MYVLIARAERKGGLNSDEGQRLRAGLRFLTDNDPGLEDLDDPVIVDSSDLAELARRYRNMRHVAWKWKRRARALATNTPAPQPKPTRTPADDEARAALHRVTALAQRWTHIPAKRQAGAAVLAAITNKDPDD